jgi:hypothetical protein
MTSNHSTPSNTSNRSMHSNNTNRSQSSNYSSCTQSSNTSSKYHGHESLSTFHDKIKQLCAAKLGPRGIETERMEGGGFNRVIGVTVYPEKWTLKWLLSSLPGFLRRQLMSEPTEKYVLRIPRWEHGEYTIDHEVTLLHFARLHTTLPVPRVPLFDSSSSNAINSTYMMQERLPGVRLSDCWDKLSHA